jgi:hypothetical protein
MIRLFIIQYAMKTYGLVEVQLHAFLTLALDGGEWSASRPSSFTSSEKAAGINWTGGWVDPRTGLDAVAKRNQTPVVQPVA